MFYYITIIKFCSAKNDYRRSDGDGHHDVLESFILSSVVLFFLKGFSFKIIK